ncbi:hypothetical protein CPC08DRAFT_719560 [Agrocybe pediades]|nr:hypothetical protein CPC08DRAFT_719560 [Agrocybe pediades]
MADPLSITLAAITLATALKDVVELAQKLNDSFEKHARNMRAAQLLAADTLEIVQDLEEFHERHREALDDAKEVRDAVVTLLGDMKSVYEKCLPITQVSKPLETKWERMKRFMRLWLDRQELEMSVHYLRDQAKKCRSRFKMRIQLGTVAAVVELKTVVKAGHMGHGRTQFGPTNSELSLRRFVRPSSSQISTLPPDVVLSEDVVYKLHIRIHVGKLDSIFKVLALRRLSPIEEPDHYHSSDIVVEDVMPPSTSEAVDHLRGETMVNIIRAQQELNVQSDDVSMQRGALAATRLSVDLYYLEMYEEAITLGQWAIDLYRSLTSRSNRQDAYTPHLALALSMLSKELAQLHDRGQSRTLISECLAVLKSCTPTFGVEIFTAETLSYSAYSHGLGIDHPETLPKLQDAAARFDRLLSGENQYTLDASVSPQEHVIYIKPPEVNIGHYARALKRLCLCLCVAGRFREALDPGLKALELFRVLASRYKGDLLTHTHIAHLCMSLCLGRSILAFTPAQALTYAEEAIQYWETASKTTAKNSEDLLNCFMEKAKILMDLERFDDAFKAFQKAAGVIHSMDNYQWTQLEKLEVSSEWFYNTGNYYLAEQASKVVVDLCRQYEVGQETQSLKSRRMGNRSIKEERNVGREVAGDIMINIIRTQQELNAHNDGVSIQRGLNHLDTLPKLQDAVARFARLLSGVNHHGVQDTFASSVSLQGHDIYMEPQDLNLYHYAEALRRLCLCLCVAGSYREALGPGLKALELFRVLASRTLRRAIKPCFLPAQAFAYAEESIQNWEIASSTTAIDSDDLIDSFMKKTEILIDLERFNDAFKAFQNAAGVTRSMDTYQWTHLETLQEVSSRFYSTGKYYLAEQTSKVVVDLCRKTYVTSTFTTDPEQYTTTTFLFFSIFYKSKKRKQVLEERAHESTQKANGKDTKERVVYV